MNGQFDLKFETQTFQTLFKLNTVCVKLEEGFSLNLLRLE